MSGAPILYCFPPAGAGSVMYRGWQTDLTPIRVQPLVWPGRENLILEPPLDDLGALVALAQRLVDASRPFAFFGHSLGALVAFEVARTLRRGGAAAPLAVFVSGFRAPQLPMVRAPIHHLPDDELLVELDRYNGTPREVLEHEDLRALLLPALRADLTAAERYRYEDDRPLACPLFAFGGDDDPYVTREELAAWRLQAAGAFRLRMFPGDHFFLHEARAELLAAIRRELGA